MKQLMWVVGGVLVFCAIFFAVFHKFNNGIAAPDQSAEDINSATQ